MSETHEHKLTEITVRRLDSVFDGLDFWNVGIEAEWQLRAVKLWNSDSTWRACPDTHPPVRRYGEYARSGNEVPSVLDARPTQEAEAREGTDPSKPSPPSSSATPTTLPEGDNNTGV
jgi:hypothetical protein